MASIPQAAYDSYSFYRDRRHLRSAVCLRLLCAAGADGPRIPPRRCRKSPTRGARTRSRSAPASASRQMPRSRASRASSIAEDYVYSCTRIFDPKVRSYWLYLFEGNLVGLDEPLAAARNERNLGLRRRARGIAHGRSLHAADQVQATELRLRVVARIQPVLGGGARGRRGVQGRVESRDGESRGTGAYRLKQWTRGSASCSKPTRTIATSPIRPPVRKRARRCRHRQGAHGAKTSAGGQRRHLDHRGGAAAAPVL
jgi:hypothetical protein